MQNTHCGDDWNVICCSNGGDMISVAREKAFGSRSINVAGTGSRAVLSTTVTESSTCSVRIAVQEAVVPRIRGDDGINHRSAHYVVASDDPRPAISSDSLAIVPRTCVSDSRFCGCIERRARCCDGGLE